MTELEKLPCHYSMALSLLIIQLHATTTTNNAITITTNSMPLPDYLF